ncbi:hypothetical protein V8E55_011575 [Tylopilus felleus]
MEHSSKRAKTTTTLTGNDSAHSASASTVTQPQFCIPFQTGPSLERIPDDVLHEIPYPLSPIIMTPTLRALSQTSRLLRSRCLAMAWQSIELCGVSMPARILEIYEAIGWGIMNAVRVLRACPHLRPLIRTVSVILTSYRYHSAEFIPAFAACLATLPNLTTIQVIHASPAPSVSTAIKDGFEGKQFPSVREISLPCSAHEIIKCCPNIEKVICTDGNGSTIVGSIVEGNCQQVSTLKGISTRHICSSVFKRFVELLPNLKYVSTKIGCDSTPFASFPLLDTIEIVQVVPCDPPSWRDGSPTAPSEVAASEIENASRILKGNKSQAEKTVIVTKWDATWDNKRFEFVADRSIIRETIRV